MSAADKLTAACIGLALILTCDIVAVTLIGLALGRFVRWYGNTVVSPRRRRLTNHATSGNKVVCN